MGLEDDIKDLLIEIRDNQKLSLQRQEQHLELAREQVERANKQVAESIELQKIAITKAKQVTRIAIPGILFCIALIVYLVVAYF